MSSTFNYIFPNKTIIVIEFLPALDSMGYTFWLIICKRYETILFAKIYIFCYMKSTALSIFVTRI